MTHLGISTDSPRALVAVIVGAGAVENSWAPVVRALRRFVSGPVTPQSANSIFTQLVYAMRLNAMLASHSQPPYPFDVPKRFRSVKAAIAAELLNAEASGELKGRLALVTAIVQFGIVAADRLALITTNWDRVAETTVVERLSQLHPVDVQAFHLHGTCNDAESLFLPTEVSGEVYRTWGETVLLLRKRIGIVEILQQATRLILFGLSLSPLDAELSQCLQEGVNRSSISEIIILDPSHEQVAQRLHVILADPSAVRILGVDPTDPMFPESPW